MNVLIITEDPTLDAFILEPIIKKMLAEVGRPQARVRVCRDPVFRGLEQILKAESLQEIIERYQNMVDLFLLCVDRDGNEHRRGVLDRWEQFCSGLLQTVRRRAVLAEHAWQEVEVWALAGCDDLPNEWSWRTIRAERDPKELYFDPYVRRRNLVQGPGLGRQVLGQQAAARYDRLRQLCPEDVAALEGRIRAWIANG